jgi:hypothetical protein
MSDAATAIAPPSVALTPQVSVVPSVYSAIRQSLPARIVRPRRTM